MRIDTSIYQSSPIPTQIVAPSGRVTFVNRAWHEFWDIPDQAVLQTILASYNVFTDPLLHDAGVLPLIKKAFTGEDITTPEIHYDPRSFGYPGRPRQFAAHLQPLQIMGTLEAVVMTFKAT